MKLTDTGGSGMTGSPDRTEELYEQSNKRNQQDELSSH